MSRVNEILDELNALPADQQELLARELTRTILSRRMSRMAKDRARPLPLSDAEISEIVHEARRETLRARGL